MPNKQPSFQFYPGDWRKDPGIQALDYEARGIWLELLLLMYESEKQGFLMLNGRPMCDETIRKILGIHGNKWKKTRRSLEVTGVVKVDEKTGCLYSRRMVIDADKREKMKENGRLGGNPNFHKGVSNPYYDNQKDNPLDNQKDNQKISPSSSSSLSSSEEKEKASLSEIPKRKAAPDIFKQETQGRFDRAITAYPSVNGKKLGKAEALVRFSRLSAADQERCVTACGNYARSQRVTDGYTMDFYPFVEDHRKGKPRQPWKDFVEPEIDNSTASTLNKSIVEESIARHEAKYKQQEV